MSSNRQLSGVWAQRAEVFRPPLEGRDIVEFPPPNLSQTSDTEQAQFDRLSLSDGFSPGNTTTSRPVSGYGSKREHYQYHHHHQQNSPSVIGARRSLSDNMNQALAASPHHPLPPPQRHTGGYYSQSSSTSSQGSVRGGGGQGQQLQGAWATPGKSGAAVVRSGSIVRNLSLNRDLSLSPGVARSGGTASPMFSLSRHSSTSSLTSSGSVTPASSGTRTPVTMQPGGGHYALISSSASKLEKMKREGSASGGQQYQHGCNGGGRGGYPLKHSVSGPAISDARGRNRTQSQQFRENDFKKVNVTPRRNVSSQNFQQMRSQGQHERSGRAAISRPLSESFGDQVQAGDRVGEFQPRSYSDSQSRSPGVRRSNQPSRSSGKTGYQKNQQSMRGKGGGRGRGRGRNS